MLLELERAAVVRHARRLRDDGLVVGTCGNVSVRSGDLLAITPTGIPYEDLEPAAVAVVDELGAYVDGRCEPSSELPMHLAAYEATGAGAVVHTHSPFATVLATLGIELPPIHYLAAALGGAVPVAPYATFGTEELAESVRATLAGRTAVLLERHGTLTVGDTLERAYDRALTLEWLSALYVRVSWLGGVVAPLDDDELERVGERLERRARACAASAF